MTPGAVVRYTNPEPGEEGLRFVLLEHNGDRVLIIVVEDDGMPWKYRINPVECVPTAEVMEAK